METIKQTFLKYYFVVSAIALAVLYMLFDRRGREISKLHADAQTALLAQQLADIKQRSVVSEESYEKANNDYASLRARHGELLTKLGLGLPAVTNSESEH